MSENQPDETWQRYGRALISAMSGVLEEADEADRELLLETADFWLSLGLTIGLERREEAEELIAMLQGTAKERAELILDADALLDEAVR